MKNWGVRPNLNRHKSGSQPEALTSYATNTIKFGGPMENYTHNFNFEGVTSFY